ncbi:MAG: hypothetical protein SFV51_01455 [Bryobacteraceae bacterium]|nr:hypothetical protein [Bryobacteraceae bacterium]
MRILLMGLLTAGALVSADPAVIEKGRAEEKRQCVACHGLRIIQVQRLSRAAWGRELDKMANWGAALEDRESLIEYLVANFGDDKPLPAPPLSKDGRK